MFLRFVELIVQESRNDCSSMKVIDQIFLEVVLKCFQSVGMIYGCRSVE